jgi:hypothetical protein
MPVQEENLRHEQKRRSKARKVLLVQYNSASYERSVKPFAVLYAWDLRCLEERLPGFSTYNLFRVESRLRFRRQLSRDLLPV